MDQSIGFVPLQLTGPLPLRMPNKNLQTHKLRTYKSCKTDCKRPTFGAATRKSRLHWPSSEFLASHPACLPILALGGPQAGRQHGAAGGDQCLGWGLGGGRGVGREPPPAPWLRSLPTSWKLKNCEYLFLYHCVCDHVALQLAVPRVASPCTRVPLSRV